MRLVLAGHEYKYAVEQIMLALFPGERPVYSSDLPFGSDELIMGSALRYGSTFAQASTSIRCGSKVSFGAARIGINRLTDKLTSDRLLQSLVKQSFYRAAQSFLATPPVWGSLTGIRPAKLVLPALESGAGENAAAKKLTDKYYVQPARASMCVRAARSAISLKNTLGPRDIALYIGIPFCPSRCAYCSFVSNSVEKSFKLIDPFVRTLLGEIEAIAGVVNDLGLSVIAVYIGGGTPTSIPASSLDTIMDSLSASFDLSRVREYTVEAGRPETITAENLGIIMSGGANRVCVNPQSMSGHVLDAIGRRHRPEDVQSAARLVRQSRAILNMDVIAGLPGDTTDTFRHTLDTVLGLKPENVTVHTLSLKKGSSIRLAGTTIPDGAEVASMLDYAAGRLRDSGYDPYYIYRQKFTSGGFENTGWSRHGFEGIYNICMMEELCTVVSLGGGGVTKLVSPGGRIERLFNAKYPREYIMQTDKVSVKINKIRDFYTNPGQ